MSIDRRKFIKTSSQAAALMSLAGTACASTFFGADKKLGVALVGLGNYATNQLAPSLLKTKHCQLAAIVTGSPNKVPEWQSKYGLADKDVYSYDEFDKIANNKNVDIVYVVTPNALHLPYAERAAAAGKHVICEKPLEISVDRAQKILDACKKAGTKLQVGYRLQYDPFHNELIRLAQEKVHGELKMIHSAFSFFGVNGDNWRFTDVSLSGGGPLMDLGVYCLQATRYITQSEPISVTAQSNKTYMDKMIGMEETIFWQMKFPHGVVTNCMASYAAQDNYLSISAEKGRFGLTSAYMYDGLVGYNNRESLGDYEALMHYQQAAQMDAFALNILNDTPIKASGEQGVQDMRCIEAIYEAADSGESVNI
jgi:predicted dehydrogenase